MSVRHGAPDRLPQFDFRHNPAEGALPTAAERTVTVASRNRLTSSESGLGIPEVLNIMVVDRLPILLGDPIQAVSIRTLHLEFALAELNLAPKFLLTPHLIFFFGELGGLLWVVA